MLPGFGGCGGVGCGHEPGASKQKTAPQHTAIAASAAAAVVAATASSSSSSSSASASASAAAVCLVGEGVAREQLEQLSSTVTGPRWSGLRSQMEWTSLPVSTATPYNSGRAGGDGGSSGPLLL